MENSHEILNYNLFWWKKHNIISGIWWGENSNATKLLKTSTLNNAKMLLMFISLTLGRKRHQTVNSGWICSTTQEPCSEIKSERHRWISLGRTCLMLWLSLSLRGSGIIRDLSCQSHSEKQESLSYISLTGNVLNSLFVIIYTHVFNAITHI